MLGSNTKHLRCLNLCVPACSLLFLFFFKQKTAYELRISDWSSDVCSSDLCNIFSPDKMLQGRLFSYGDTQRYRLGVNFNHIPEISRASCRVRVCQYV